MICQLMQNETQIAVTLHRKVVGQRPKGSASSVEAGEDAFQFCVLQHLHTCTLSMRHRRAGAQ